MRLGKTIAHIPARGGSKRVPAKNLRLLAGKPLIFYAIEAALSCSELEEVYVNTDSPEIEEVAREYGAKVYRRPPELGSDEATGDDFTIDFIEAINPHTLVMISPVCPLVESTDIMKAIKIYSQSEIADTLITCSVTRMQTFCGKNAVNFNLRGPLAPTQYNKVVSICNWAVTIWNADLFRKHYKEFNGGYCGENRILFPIDPWKSIKISEESDFIMAEKLMLIK